MANNLISGSVDASYAVSRSHGQLVLVFDYDAACKRTRLVSRESRPPLQVVRPFDLPDGGVLLHIQNVAGGVLGGDLLDVNITLNAGARVQLTTTGANRIYRPRETDGPAVQSTKLYVGAGSLLEYLPDPTIPFASARYRQTTNITLGDGAGLYWWEVLSPGRTAHGEVFAYEKLDIAASIDTEDGSPVVRERNVVRGQGAPLPPNPGGRTALGSSLGPYRYLATFYAMRVGASSIELLDAERSLTDLALELSVPGETVWGVSALSAHGLVVRGLSCRSRTLNASLIAFWRHAKRLLHNEDIVIPRKVW